MTPTVPESKAAPPISLHMSLIRGSSQVITHLNSHKRHGQIGNLEGAGKEASSHRHAKSSPCASVLPARQSELGSQSYHTRGEIKAAPCSLSNNFRGTLNCGGRPSRESREQPGGALVCEECS